MQSSLNRWLSVWLTFLHFMSFSVSFVSFPLVSLHNCASDITWNAMWMRWEAKCQIKCQQKSLQNEWRHQSWKLQHRSLLSTSAHFHFLSFLNASEMLSEWRSDKRQQRRFSHFSFNFLHSSSALFSSILHFAHAMDEISVERYFICEYFYCCSCRNSEESNQNWKFHSNRFTLLFSFFFTHHTNSNLCAYIRVTRAETWIMLKLRKRWGTEDSIWAEEHFSFDFFIRKMYNKALHFVQSWWMNKFSHSTRSLD